ncbi:MAG: sigma-70 family RNA polymerase sigma factor [Planctomycetes bacterium]|nr:sigma-70 family RNA polymerase sigma factor [Planctomycetota bacterium]
MADQSQPTDAELVIAVRGGDRQAFGRLVQRYQRQATGVAFRLLDNRDDAMEVVQDACCRAFSKLRSLSDPQRFGPWLLRIVGNLALNRRRDRAVRRTISLDRPADASSSDDPAPGGWVASKAPGPEELASAEELKAAIGRALDELPEKQRAALVLFSMEKLSHKEVAEILGISVEAAKWNVFAARKKLKERFGDYL